MRNILLVSNSAKSMLLFRLHFMLKLLSLGFKVVVCAPYDKDDFDSLEKIGVVTENCYFSRRGMNPLLEILCLLRVYKKFAKYMPYACMFYTIKPVIYGSIVARLLRLQNVFSMITGLGYVFTGGSLLQKFLRVLVKVAYRIALKCNKKVFFLNKDDADYFLNNKIVSGLQKCLINGEGVDLERYVYTLSPKEHLEFLFVGRLLKDKGVYEYVNVARILKNRYPSVTFKLVGGLDDNPACIEKDELQSWINEGVIEYCGYLTDVRYVLKQSAVFVFPSYYREGVPVAILEAMATGRPIVTTNSVGCKETVQDGVNGYLVLPRNIGQLSAAMEKFILQPELIVKMGKESRRLVEEKYDVKKVNDAILKSMEIL